MKECELLQSCGFFKRYSTMEDPIRRRVIRQFCKGPMMEQCARKRYHRDHGEPPPDEMMPSGRFDR